jgi:hypothetical protein
MKTIAMITLTVLCSIATQAKTYTIGSGKWTDPKIWGTQYIGSTIKAGDVVFITGQVTLTMPLVVEGKLQIERGASLIGMKDLHIGKGGFFINRGNAVVRRIINEGTVSNFQAMEAMMDIETTGTMENNSYILAGNDFETKGGNAFGRGGRMFANNAASLSPSTEWVLGISLLAQKQKE